MAACTVVSRVNSSVLGRESLVGSFAHCNIDAHKLNGSSFNSGNQTSRRSTQGVRVTLLKLSPSKCQPRLLTNRNNGARTFASAGGTNDDVPATTAAAVEDTSHGAEHTTQKERWDAVTQQLTAASSIVGLFMMMPQIVMNARLLLAGNGASLGVLSWVGYATGYLGNMLLLSYFTARREQSACFVQVVGAASTAVLLSQICLAGFMPPSAFGAVAAYFFLSCLVNALQFTNHLPPALWDVWLDFVGVLGLAVLPQVLWSTFSSVPTQLPGILSVLCGLLFIALMRAGLLPEKARASWQLLSGWTATLLFMLMPVAQLKMCFAFPERIAGMSAGSSLLGIVGNGLMIPRALFTRDFIWLLGSSWGALTMGWGVLLAMWINKAFSTLPFALTSAFLATYLVFIAKQDSIAHK